MSQDDVAGSAQRWDFEERRRVIRKKRKELGLSQQRLADLADVAVFTVSRFETGAQDIKPKTLAKIEEALTDAIAARRMTQMLRAQRQQVGTLSQMVSPRPGSEAYWQARE